MCRGYYDEDEVIFLSYPYTIAINSKNAILIYKKTSHFKLIHQVDSVQIPEKQKVILIDDSPIMTKVTVNL